MKPGPIYATCADCGRLGPVSVCLERGKPERKRCERCARAWFEAVRERVEGRA